MSNTPDDRKQFASGAVRSNDAESTRYDLITPVGLRRLAETYAEGAAKYGDHNWQKGIPASDLLNHAIRHVYLWLSGDRSEDHLAHASWGLFAVMHFEERMPEMVVGTGCEGKVAKPSVSSESSRAALKELIDYGIEVFLAEERKGQPRAAAMAVAAVHVERVFSNFALIEMDDQHPANGAAAQ